MNIADVLAPKQLPTIDAARVRTHLLGHDDEDIPPKEKPMSRATDVADAIAKMGGRATREDLQAATGLEGKQMENGITCARTAGLVTRDGRDYVLTNGAAPKASKKAAPAKKKPAAKPKKPAATAEQLPRILLDLIADRMIDRHEHLSELDAMIKRYGLTPKSIQKQIDADAKIQAAAEAAAVAPTPPVTADAVVVKAGKKGRKA